MKQKVYAIEYTHNEKKYSMQLLGTEEEVKQHADNLGLGEPEFVNINVPEFYNEFH